MTFLKWELFLPQEVRNSKLGIRYLLAQKHLLPFAPYLGERWPMRQGMQVKCEVKESESLSTVWFWAGQGDLDIVVCLGWSWSIPIPG